MITQEKYVDILLVEDDPDDAMLTLRALKQRDMGDRVFHAIDGDEPLARERIRQLLHKEPDIEILGECADGRDAVAAIDKYKPDLVFLDVQMPELDGFGVLDQLERRVMPAIVFVTAYDQFALRAFEVHALDYLLKPFDGVRFKKALERARERIECRPGADL